ncbi:MAG: hypothetical protein ACTJIA_02305, partial [Halomonas sp.]
VQIGHDHRNDRSRSPEYAAEVTLMLDGRIMMQVKGENLGSQEIAVDLMRDWDLAAVREQSAR